MNQLNKYNLNTYIVDEQDPDIVHEASVTEKLAALAIKWNLPDGAVRDFGSLLRELGQDLPVDARTILKRSRSKPDSNSFHHFGLKKGIFEKMRAGLINDNQIIQLIVNIDGIPLSKSSSLCFWPILAMIPNCKEPEPFIVSIFCGYGEPSDIQAFTGPFIHEMKGLEENGIIFEDTHYVVKLCCVSCDTPARKLCKKTKGHGGKGGCDRCIQPGRSFGRGRWIFDSFTSKLRTDESFRRRTNLDHQHFPHHSKNLT